ncbi:hypothetical protein KO317_01670 [Candidatus Micrarchaeota archaeon]|jgi:hypothetical protein|nr:hypothetical protein [Candidatus Micrarchaeota archaeon]
MNFETLNKNSSTNYRGSKKPKASRARRIAVWTGLFLGGIALTASTTSCSKEHKETKKIEKLEKIKSIMEEQIMREIDIIYSTPNISGTQLPLGGFMYTEKGERIYPYLELGTVKGTVRMRDYRYTITKEEMLEIIDRVAENNPQAKFEIKVSVKGESKTYLLVISKTNF